MSMGFNIVDIIIEIPIQFALVTIGKLLPLGPPYWAIYSAPVGNADGKCTHPLPFTISRSRGPNHSPSRINAPLRRCKGPIVKAAKDAGTNQKLMQFSSARLQSGAFRLSVRLSIYPSWWLIDGAYGRRSFLNDFDWAKYKVRLRMVDGGVANILTAAPPSTFESNVLDFYVHRR